MLQMRRWFGYRMGYEDRCNLYLSKEYDFKIIEGKVASLEKEFGPTDFTFENILKGFQFGIDDISIPGKDPKAKPPELNETSPESEKEVEDGKGDDESQKEEEQQASTFRSI